MNNSVIKPLIIGKKIFSTNLIQAPLAGISCAPFRELVWQFGGVAYCCTEMLSAYDIANDNDRSPRFQARSPIEKNLCWQLSGNKPDLLARASYHAIKNGADILDLNCGCPQPKIRKKGCGSKLLSDEKKLSELVKAMRQDDHTPITLKMRIDAGHGEFCEISVAKMLENTGVDAIIVHGRHWTHDYDVPCQLESIAKIVDAVSIPVIGNGDISDAQSIKNVFTETRCAGFMIGRASVGQPWIYQQITLDLREKRSALLHACSQSSLTCLSTPVARNRAPRISSFCVNPISTPTPEKIGELFLQHARGLITLDGEKSAMLQCRKFGKYYARTLENKSAFLETLYQVNSFDELELAIQKYFL